MEGTEIAQSFGGRPDVKSVACRIANCLVAPGFAVDPSSTVLFLNSLISALHSRHRIYLSAFQRSGEILNYFGHRLRRLGFDVHSLDPRSIIPSPKPRDVLICVSGSLRTEPVLVSLMHAELGGLYKFVVTAQSLEETHKKFQNVLPVNIPGVTSDGRAAEEDLRAILPLGSLFELRAFLYFEAVIEVLGEVLCEPIAAGDANVACAGPSPDLMGALTRVREGASKVPAIMRSLVENFLSVCDRVDDSQLDGLLDQLLDTAHNGSTTYVTGYGRNSEIGCLFVHRLANLWLPVALTPSRLERPTRRGDLLVAVTSSGQTYEVLQRLAGARRSGLRTTVVTAVLESAACANADVRVIVPSREPTHFDHYTARQFQPLPAVPPSRSTFSLNAILILEAIIAVLMQLLGKREKDLARTDPWQGFDSPDRSYAPDGDTTER